MAYDPSKDKQVQAFNTIRLDDKTIIELGVHSYDGGEPKLRARRVTTSAKGKDFGTVLCRCNRHEASYLVDALQQWLAIAS